MACRGPSRRPRRHGSASPFGRPHRLDPVLALCCTECQRTV
ncbi:unnamed protein product [[Actinomadura] parvosata subsp. kistnae]|nr:unnamed protein product [Actinomadura parvosata subsp. kistnae]